MTRRPAFEWICSIAVMFVRVIALERDEAFVGRPLGDLVERFLGDGEHVARLARRVERGAHDAVAHHDEAAQHRLFFDDLRVPLDVRDVGHDVHERGDVGDAADLVELGVLGQLFLQRERLDVPALLGHAAHGGEDRAVRVLEEIVGVDRADDAVEGVVVDEDRRRERRAPHRGSAASACLGPRSDRAALRSSAPPSM